MSRVFPPFRPLEGEAFDVCVTAAINSKDGVALLYFCGGDEKACVVQSCSLALSQLQIQIGPMGREKCVEMPYLSVATWGIGRATSPVAKAFAQVQQQAEEAARIGGGMSPGNVGLVTSGGAGGIPVCGSPAVMGTPLLVASPSQTSPPPPRPLYVVSLQSKHVWQFRLIVQSERLVRSIRVHLAMASCVTRVVELPAFPYAEGRQCPPVGLRDNGNVGGSGSSSASREQVRHTEGSDAAMWHTEFGWNIYSPQREFTRQLCVDASRQPPALVTEADVLEGRVGVRQDLRPWFSLVDLRVEAQDVVSNEERPADYLYTCSPTYPELFLEPKVVDRELLSKAMIARSRARVPAISYVCLRTGAILARSSQPLTRSCHLAADSDVCYSLINMGYAPHHAQPRRTIYWARGASAPPTVAVTASAAGQMTHTRNCSPVAVAAAHHRRDACQPLPTKAVVSPCTKIVRPPSLFDDDSDGECAPVFTCTTGHSAVEMQSEGSPAHNHDRASTLTEPPAPSTPSRPSVFAATPTSGDAASHSATPAAETSPNAAVAKVLLVADCRPQITAAGNAQLGGGYESGCHYTFCQLQFFEIDNIFGVAKSFEKLRSLLTRYQGNTAEKTFLRRLYESDWLAIIQRVLVCAVSTAQSLQVGVSCLVHCTDGWDRTSQCTALAMLLLDPYYRTILGFCTLIEKEFCSFGHKFAERSGHQVPGRTTVYTHSGVSSSDVEQQRSGSGGSAPRLDTSPIFLQFLDAVFQVHRQYPMCFEFTPELLAYLSEVVYSCLYGTFLCNGEQERRLEGVKLRTASVWTDILREVQREKNGEVPLRFVNIRFDAATAWRFIAQRRCGRCEDGAGGVSSPLADFVLWPNCSSKRLVLWEELYTREDADHYLSYNPNVRTVKTVQKVSWGDDFDAFLQAEIVTACEARTREVGSLKTLEAIMNAESMKPSASLAANGARSAWCTFDAVNCFNCCKAFGMWSAKSQCTACKQYLCSDCHTHDCVTQPY